MAILGIVKVERLKENNEEFELYSLTADFGKLFAERA